MDRTYYESPVGSAEHRAAYAAEFAGHLGIGYPVETEAEASYEIDHAAELAMDRHVEWCGEQDGPVAMLGLPIDHSPLPEAVLDPEPELEMEPEF